jgi:large subunit ribosomal protein L21
MSRVKDSEKEGSKSVAKKAATQKEQVAKSDFSGFAVIETGGKQYRVAVGDRVKIEKIKGNFKVGDQVVFDKVLLVDNGQDSTDIGTPYLPAKVLAKIIEIGRNRKVTVIKYKQKSRYFKKNGHRQPYFKVEIDKIA